MQLNCSPKEIWRARNSVGVLQKKQEDKESTDSLYSMRLESFTKMWNCTASWKKKYGQKEQTWNEGILKVLVYNVFSISQHLGIDTLVNFNHKLYF